jgi:endonuclease III
LKPILPPSTFFIPGYEGLQSDDSHVTEAEEERDDIPVRNCHNGGRDDIADDSINRDIVNKGPDDIVNNKATKPIKTIRRSPVTTSIRRSLRPHGKPTLRPSPTPRRSKRLIERISQHPPSSKVSELGKPRRSVEKKPGQGHAGRDLHFSCCLFKSSRQEILPLSPTDTYLLNKYLVTSTPENVFNRSVKNIDLALNPSLWTRDKKLRWENFTVKARDARWVKKNLLQLSLLSAIVEECLNHGLTSIRMNWTYMLSSVCVKVGKDSNYRPNLDPHIGCGFCSGCHTRMAQAVISLRTCQGLGDKVTVPYWHYIFHHTEYKSFTLGDWAGLDVRRLSEICFPTSCWKKASTESSLYLKWLFHHNNSRLPTDVSEIMQIHGMGLKTAALILYSIYGRNFAVANDRHVCRSSVLLDWVSDLISSSGPIKDIQPEEGALMIMEWLPRPLWGKVNNYLGCIAQWMDEKDTAPLVLKIARKKGLAHEEIIRLLHPAV